MANADGWPSTAVRMNSPASRTCGPLSPTIATRCSARRAAGAFLLDKGDDLGIRSSMDIDQLLENG